jgi:peptidoglycan/LPS O-acetylase OafA/YrhL
MSKSQLQHFQFLDGLRFLCALWVVFQHLGVPPVFSLLAEVLPHGVSGLALLAHKGFTAMFSGSAAVVAFFIISGFCIHYPYAAGKDIKVIPFYFARGVRIGVPVLFATVLAYITPDGTHAISVVLWSLYAEIIYYAIYPLLLKLIHQLGINKTLLLSSLGSAALLLFPDSNGGYLFSYGIAGTWFLCLPIWLMGCWVAEAIVTGKYRSFASNTRFMPALRVLVVAVSVACKLAAIYTPVQLKYSMLLFAPLCAFWILSEFLQTKPFSWFTRLSFLGRSTFSVYLIHVISPLMFADILDLTPATLGWPLTIASVIVLSAVFYFGVERPSHIMSKRMSRKMPAKLPPIAAESEKA